VDSSRSGAPYSRASSAAARTFALCGAFVRQGSVPQRHRNHIALGLIDTLFNRFGNVVRFAEPVADAAFLITDNRQRGKGKAAAAPP